MSSWVGFAVSVSCGEPLGSYQGTISETDGTTITLKKPFRNGFPYPKSQVTLNAADIKDLKIIEAAPSAPAEKSHSTVSIAKSNKKTQKATVCENLQANSPQAENPQNVNTSSSKGMRNPGPARSKPIDIQAARNNKNNNLSGSYGNANSSTPKGQHRGPFVHDKARRRNEACFGDTADPALRDDFDFEGNLALFDKQAIWEEMRTTTGVRPDVVRAADGAARCRHDENVLGTAPAPAAIRLPDALRGSVVYTADDGIRVPSINARLRRDLWRVLLRQGLADATLTLLGRAAADVALRLAGGGRRFEPRNAHQAPAAVAVVGPHAIGACGVITARLLASHGAHAHVLVTNPSEDEILKRELTAFTLGGGTLHNDVAELPPPDVVVLALYDPTDGTETTLDSGSDKVLQWVRSARAAVLTLEPPGAGLGLASRAAIVAGLPPALPAELGRVFLANVALPPLLFHKFGIHYRPPFGAASVLALN